MVDDELARVMRRVGRLSLLIQLLTVVGYVAFIAFMGALFLHWWRGVCF